jgi:N-acetylglutamate synthase
VVNEVPSPLLGPQSVGLRVVVRSIVPGETGPTGGPVFTDVIGICTDWTDADCVVTRSSGEVVRIPRGLIVAGKPAPAFERKRRDAEHDQEQREH